MNIVALGNYAVIKPFEVATRTSSGLYLTDNNKKSIEGIIVAVGPGVVSTSGVLISSNLSVGDQVIFNDVSSTEVKIDGKIYLILKEDDIYVVLKENV